MFETATSIMGSPVEAGLQFIWAISFGQILTIGLFILGMISGAIKLGSIILALRAQQIVMDKRIDTLEENMGQRMNDLVRDLAAIEGETRQDVRELRSAITDLNRTLLTIKIIGVDFSKFDKADDKDDAA